MTQKLKKIQNNTAPTRTNTQDSLSIANTHFQQG